MLQLQKHRLAAFVKRVLYIFLGCLLLLTLLLYVLPIPLHLRFFITEIGNAENSSEGSVDGVLHLNCLTDSTFTGVIRLPERPITENRLTISIHREKWGLYHGALVYYLEKEPLGKGGGHLWDCVPFGTLDFRNILLQDAIIIEMDEGIPYSVWVLTRGSDKTVESVINAYGEKHPYYFQLMPENGIPSMPFRAAKPTLLCGLVKTLSSHSLR